MPLDSLIQDLRYALRSLRRSPGFASACVLTLALGIGANTAIFSVVQGVLLRSLPYAEPERLVSLTLDKPAVGMRGMSLTYGILTNWRENATTLEGVTGWFETSATLTGGAEPEQVYGAQVLPGFFAVFGFRPVLGRDFTHNESLAGAGNAVILSHALWQRRFGGDPSIIGRTVTLNHTAQHEVVGIMPAEARDPAGSEYWTPVSGRDPNDHNMHMFSVVARLAPSATLTLAAREVTLLQDRLAAGLPGAYDGWIVRARTLHDTVVGGVRRALLIVFGAVSVVLLIACANVANLFLARAAARRREMAVRSAIGANTGRIVRQLLTETALLAVVGSCAGLLLAAAALQFLRAFAPPDIPRLGEIAIDAPVFLYTLGATCIMGFLFGAAPAIQLARIDVSTALKNGVSSDRASGWWRGGRVTGPRGVIVTAQVALSVLLLTGAGLLINSLVRLGNVELGFEPKSAVAIAIEPAFSARPDSVSRTAYYGALLDELRAVPGVTAAGAVTGEPLGGTLMNLMFSIVGQPEPGDGTSRRTFLNVATPGYFEAAGARLLVGRPLAEGDRAGSTAVVVVNRTLQRRYFPAGAIGQHLRIGTGKEARDVEVVGVIADIRQFGVADDAEPNAFVPLDQFPARRMALVVRTAGDPTASMALLRAAVRRSDPAAPITRMRTLEQSVSGSLRDRRFYASLLSAFSALSLLLCTIGLYGVLSYAVNTRTREIGIRMALGARSREIMRQVVARGLLLTAVGVAIGMGTAFVLTRLLESLLYGVASRDALTFALSAVGLACAATIASCIPARRAVRVDPVLALRAE